MKPKIALLGFNKLVADELRKFYIVKHFYYLSGALRVCYPDDNLEVTWDKVLHSCCQLEINSEANWRWHSLFLLAEMRYSRPTTGMHGMHANQLAAMRAANLLLHDADLLVAEDLPHLDCGVAMTAYAKAKNIPVIYAHHSPFVATHLISSKEDLGQFIPRGNHAFLNPDNRALKAINLSYMKGIFGPRASILRILRFLVRTAKEALDIDLTLDHAIHARLQLKFRQILRKACQDSDEIDRLTKKRSFVYFPLHLQPEMTTHLLGGIYSNQLLALDRLRSWLPDNICIVVKENPKQTYRERSRLFYELINGLPNTVLAPITYSTHELIDRSLAVATISGTAGFEALQSSKPCILFGNSWYQDFPGVLQHHKFSTTSFERLIANEFDLIGFEEKLRAFKETMVRAGSLAQMHKLFVGASVEATEHSMLIAASLLQAISARGFSAAESVDLGDAYCEAVM